MAVTMFKTTPAASGLWVLFSVMLVTAGLIRAGRNIDFLQHCSRAVEVGLRNVPSIARSLNRWYRSLVGLARGAFRKGLRPAVLKRPW